MFVFGFSNSSTSTELLFKVTGPTCGWRIANQPRNPLKLSSLVILGVVARMSRRATRSSYWFT